MRVLSRVSSRMPWHLIVLSLITLGAAGVRFARLDHPPLLIDECFTFWRTCGSYNDLVDTLRNDGFVPLHYELLWWISRGLPLSANMRLVRGGLFLTPHVMRFVPAICGTLMIPAIYFVARQLFRRSTSLLAAGLVACSAYAMFFSRDAKMYMPTWLFGTLAVGCLMWWLRTRRSTAWLAWVAAGAAAGGFHVVTLLLLPLAPVMLLTQRRVHWRDALLMLAGVALIAAGPIGYYTAFNRWAERSGGLVPGVTSEPAPDANWDASGLNWIPSGESGAGAAFESLSTYLTAYEWDGETSSSQWFATPSWMRRTVIAGVSLIVGSLLLGLLPWPARWRATSAVANGDTPAPAWRPALWLMCWVAIPAYGFFYCRSYDDPASPADWLSMIVGWWGSSWPWLVASAIAMAALASYLRIARIVLGVIVAIAAVVVVLLFARDPSDIRFSSMAATITQAAALIVVPATLWVYAGETTRQRLRTTLPLLMAAAIVLGLCAGAHAVWSSVRAISLAKHPELQWRTIWHTRYIGIVWPAIWIAAAALVMRLPTLPVRILVVALIVSANLANGIARFTAQTQVPYDRVFADVWSARPGTSVRTFFNLSERLFGGDGLPMSVYWRPMVAYNACLAARMETSPADFRTGKVWPFEYGPMLNRFQDAVVYRPATTPNAVATEIAKSPEVRTIIVWDITGFAQDSEQYLSRLGPQWHLVSDQSITAWWYWTWQHRFSFRRQQFERLITTAQ
jgi:hypothetical protein